MSAPEPGSGILLSAQGEPTAIWKLVPQDLARLRAAVGKRQFRDLLRCFLWCDRLTSLSILGIGEGTPAHDAPARAAATRNLMTTFWLQAGCMYELTRALVSIDDGNLRPRLSPDGIDALAALHVIRKRWSGERLAQMRNIGGFHLDDEAFDAGIEGLVEMNAGDSLAEGHGPHTGSSWFPLAHAALFRGMWPDGHDEAFPTIAKEIGADVRVVGSLVQRVLLGLLPPDAVERSRENTTPRA